MTFEHPAPTHIASRGEPTDDDIRSYRSALDSSKLDLAEIQDAIRKLEKRREMVESTVTSYKALLSPIRRLPRDMLEEIFLHCLPIQCGVMSSQEAPLLLGRVCSWWREAAYSTPALWSSVHGVLSLDQDESDFMVKQNAIASWIERSKSLPISISIAMPQCSCCIMGDHAAVNRLRDAMSVLTKFSARFQNLELRDAQLVSAFLTREITPGEFSQLKTLAIRFDPIRDPDRSADGQDALAPFLSTTKNLRRLSLTLRLSGVDALDLAIPAALLDLRINTFLPASRIITSLQRFPELINLSLSIELSQEDLEAAENASAEPPALLEFPRLQALTVYSTRYLQNTAQVLSSISVPRLRHLSCHYTGWYPDPDNPSQNSFLPATPYSLQSLSYTVSPVSCYELTEYLASRSDLRRLRIIEPIFWDPSRTEISETEPNIAIPSESGDNVHLLQVLTTTTKLCPKLETLEWPYFRHPVEPLSIIQFVKSRIDTPLRESKFGFCSNISVEKEALLQEFASQQEAAGVHCDFHFPFVYCSPPPFVSPYYGLEPSSFSSRYPGDNYGGVDDGLDWPGTTF